MYDLHGESIGSACHKHITTHVVHITSSTHSSAHMPFYVNEADANMTCIPAIVPGEMAVYCADMLSTGFMGAEHDHIPLGGTVAVFAEAPVGLMAVVVTSRPRQYPYNDITVIQYIQ